METLGQIFCDYGSISRLLLEKFNPTATDTEWEEALLAYESGLDGKIVELLRSDPYVLFSEKHGHDDIPSVVLLRPDPARVGGGCCVSRRRVRSIITAHIDRKMGFLSVKGHCHGPGRHAPSLGRAPEALGLCGVPQDYT